VTAHCAYTGLKEATILKNNITMRDIADRLGVSSVTVSKALNDKDGVSGELKEKIKVLAIEMGYRYNAAARSMKEGLTHNIGVIIPERLPGLHSRSMYACSSASPNIWRNRVTTVFCTF